MEFLIRISMLEGDKVSQQTIIEPNASALGSNTSTFTNHICLENVFLLDLHTNEV